MDLENIPNHVGIIMDGNGRWAKKRGLNRSLGHKKGAETLEKLLNHIYNLGIKYVSIYAFSTENFKRDSKEVNYLMDLFVKMFSTKKKIFVKNQLRVLFSGRRDNLRDDVRESMEKLEEVTKDFTKGTFNICLNYGGRDEITHMAKILAQKVVEKQINLDDITEKLVNQNMYQELPDLDVVIRTSGEMRISNFMLWQSSYAEYFFPKVYFPDFNNEEFDKIMVEYSTRNRRFGA